MIKNKKVLILTILLIVLLAALGLTYFFSNKISADILYGTKSAIFTKVEPATFNPTLGESTLFQVKIGEIGTYQIEVRDKSNKSVRILRSFTKVTPNLYSGSWDGKNSTGAYANNGEYYVYILKAASRSRTQIVAKASVVIGNAPTVDLKGNDTDGPITILSGGSVLLSWTSENATSCYSTGNWENILRSTSGDASMENITKDGTFTISCTNGTTITSDTVEIKVNQTATTPEPEPITIGSNGSAGNKTEGAGTTNVPSNTSRKIALGFISDKTATTNSFSFVWKNGLGYSGGTNGQYRFSIVPAGPDTLPMSNELGSATKTSGLINGTITIPLSVSLTQNAKYFIIIQNIDPTPSTNWSDVDVLITRDRAWDGEGVMLQYENTWRVWNSPDNIWNSSQTVNGLRSVYAITWADNSVSGQGLYYSYPNNPLPISTSAHAGEYFTWNGETRTVSAIKLAVNTITPGTLRYHIEKADGTGAASGTMTNTTNRNERGILVPEWSTGSLSSAYTLQKGQTYRLWFDASSGSYSTIVCRSMSEDLWRNATWGAKGSYFIKRSNSGAWSEGVGTAEGTDLSFDFE